MADNEEKTENQEPEATEPEATEGVVEEAANQAAAEQAEVDAKEKAEKPEPKVAKKVEAEAEKPVKAAAKKPAAKSEAKETAAKAGKAEAKKADAGAKEKPAAKKKAAPKKARAKKKVAKPKQEINVPEVNALEGKQAGLDPKVFEIEPKIGVLHEVVRAEFASMRRGTASTKNRAEVRGGGKKPWRQKGTGRARAGSSRMPHWTGGGVTFGPTPRDFSFKVNRKVRGKALKMALSVRASEGGFKVVDALPFDEPKTAAAAAILAGLDVKYPLLVLVTEADENAAMSFRNIPRVGVTDTGDLLVSDIMAARTVLATKEAVEQLNGMAEAK